MIALIPPRIQWPHRWEIVGWGAWDAVSGVSLTRYQINSAISGGIGYGGGSSWGIGDSMSFYVPMDSGTWTIHYLWSKATDRGIFTISLAGSDITTGFDQYGGGAQNQSTSWTGITVTTPGVKTLTFTCTGKNAGSSHYELGHHLISAVRTGA